MRSQDDLAMIVADRRAEIGFLGQMRGERGATVFGRPRGEMEGMTGTPEGPRALAGARLFDAAFIDASKAPYEPAIAALEESRDPEIRQIARVGGPGPGARQCPHAPVARGGVPARLRARQVRSTGSLVLRGRPPEGAIFELPWYPPQSRGRLRRRCVATRSASGRLGAAALEAPGSSGSRVARRGPPPCGPGGDPATRRRCGRAPGGGCARPDAGPSPSPRARQPGPGRCTRRARRPPCRSSRRGTLKPRRPRGGRRRRARASGRAPRPSSAWPGSRRRR